MARQRRIPAARLHANWRPVLAALAWATACGTAEPFGPRGDVDAAVDAVPSPAAQKRRLAAHLPANHAGARKSHRLDATQVVPITLVLAPQNEALLDALLADLYDPKSARYGKYLTPEEFAATFHPKGADVTALRDALVAQGFVVHGAPHGLLWRAEAPSRVIEATLGVQMHAFVAADGRHYHAPEGPLDIPQHWPIRAMLGLFESPPRRPHYHVAPAATAPRPMVNVTTGLRTAYDVPATATGVGQVLSLFELDGYVASDIAAYASARKIPQVPLKNILVGGFSGAVQDPNAQGEVTLDIELMNDVAPLAAQLRVYEIANTSNNFVALLNEMANPTLDDKLLPTLISCSWGLAEDQEAPATLQAENTLFQQMAAQGQSFFAASGDSGADADGSSLGVGDPGSQPWVVGVGGTALHVNADGTYRNESTWASGGGGISSVWSIPAWQRAAIAAGSLASTSMRNVPDVAANADPNTGYSIVLNGQVIGGVGGTSCAAPVWTAYMGLVNAQRAVWGIPPIGFANPLLYSLNALAAAYAQSFNDIHDASTNGHYPAVIGYDDATGWGSFRGAGLLSSLAAGYARKTFSKPDVF